MHTIFLTVVLTNTFIHQLPTLIYRKKPKIQLKMSVQLWDDYSMIMLYHPNIVALLLIIVHNYYYLAYLHIILGVQNLSQ